MHVAGMSWLVLLHKFAFIADVKGCCCTSKYVYTTTITTIGIVVYRLGYTIGLRRCR